MSIEYLNSAFNAEIGDSVQKFVLVALADYADENGYAYPSITTLMKKVNIKNRTNIIRCLNNLIEKRLISKVSNDHIPPRYLKKSNQNCYHLHKIQINNTPLTLVPQKHRCRNSTSTESALTLVPQKHQCLVPQKHSNHHNKPSINHHASQEPEKPSVVINKEAKQKPKTLPVDPEKIVELYHQILPELASVKLITTKRISQLKIIFKAWPNSQKLEWWGKYFNQVREYDYVMNGMNDWKASFDYFIKLEKLMMFVEKSQNE